MATGISSFLANKLLDHAFRGAAWSSPSTVYARIHTGDPGGSGNSNASAQAGRQACTWSEATGGGIVLTNSPEFVLTAPETITHVSFWTAASGGNFLASAQATEAKGGTSGDIIRISAAPISFSPIAS